MRAFLGGTSREVARLAVGGLELEPDLARRAADPDGGWRVGHVEAERAAAALGYVARLTQRLAHLLDVPLRYPLRFANSRSSVFSHALPAGTFGCVQGSLLYLLTLRAGKDDSHTCRSDMSTHSANCRCLWFCPVWHPVENYRPGWQSWNLVGHISVWCVSAVWLCMSPREMHQGGRSQMARLDLVLKRQSPSRTF
jgi:hypothetical protein